MRPSWLTAPEKWPLSQDICSHKLPRPQGWKTHTPFFTTPILSINTMSQTRRNLFFTTMEASSECRSADTNSCLRAGWLYTTLWSAACVLLQKKQGILLSLCHIEFDLHGKRDLCADVALWASVWCGLHSALRSLELLFIQRLLGISLEIHRPLCAVLIWSQCLNSECWF